MLHFNITLKDSDFPYIICLLFLEFLPYLRTRLSRIIVRVDRNSKTRGRASSYKQKHFGFGKTLGPSLLYQLIHSFAFSSSWNSNILTFDTLMATLQWFAPEYRGLKACEGHYVSGCFENMVYTWTPIWAQLYDLKQLYGVFMAVLSDKRAQASEALRAYIFWSDKRAPLRKSSDRGIQKVF